MHTCYTQYRHCLAYGVITSYNYNVVILYADALPFLGVSGWLALALESTPPSTETEVQVKYVLCALTFLVGWLVACKKSSHCVLGEWHVKLSQSLTQCRNFLVKLCESFELS